MTDDDKLEQLDDWEALNWRYFADNDTDSEGKDKALVTIERCQRIRANLQANQSIEHDEPIIVFSDDGERRYPE